MYKNQKSRSMLVILVLIMFILSLKFILVNNKFVEIKNKELFSITKVKSISKVEKYGYSDILESIGKNKDFVFKSINMLEDGICDVELNYMGDTKFLYGYLCLINESENLLGIKSININKDSNITIINIDFLKNK